MSKEKKEDKREKFTKMKTSTENHMVIVVEGEEGRIYKFSMPFYAPLPECYHASVNVANEIARLYNEAVEVQKEKDAAKEKTEEKKEEKVD